MEEISKKVGMTDEENPLTRLLACSQASVTSLVQTYAGNDYMLRRLQSHLEHHLPNLLANEWRHHQQRQTRLHALTSEQQLFIQVFISRHQYFYLASNGCFFEYQNGVDYRIVQADDIIHRLLTSITRDMKLVEWKHKTKLNVLKQIKDRSLFNSVPESATIQVVLGALYPAFFATKNAAKHFLTMLGDQLLRKAGVSGDADPALIYVMSPVMRGFLAEVEAVAQYSFGLSNVFGNCVGKYHEAQAYGLCRLLRMREDAVAADWIAMLKKQGLNLLCVAVHYAKRHGCADGFLESKGDSELSQYVWFLRDSSQADVFALFCQECLKGDETEESKGLEWKQLLFIWKQFLSTRQLPNILFSVTLKQLMTARFGYAETTDAFLGVTSRMTPVYHFFAQFWLQTMRAINPEEDFEADLEAEEVCTLFKQWVAGQAANVRSSVASAAIEETAVLNMLAHFFPDVEVVDRKFIQNTVCLLWDKTGEIQRGLQSWQPASDDVQVVSFEEVYDAYKRLAKDQRWPIIASKRFFEKYVAYRVPDLILFDRFLDARALRRLE